MKDLAILSLELIFFILASLQKSQQNICNSICLALSIIDANVITQEFLGPMYLSGVQTLCIHEAAKVVVVFKNKDIVFTAS